MLELDKLEGRGALFSIASLGSSLSPDSQAAPCKNLAPSVYPKV